VPEADEAIGMPNFRPFSFLTNLAERVLPGEPEAPVETNGNGTGPETIAATPAAPPTTNGRARKPASVAVEPASDDPSVVGGEPASSGGGSAVPDAGPGDEADAVPSEPTRG
jgi:hypothetical protein